MPGATHARTHTHGHTHVEWLKFLRQINRETPKEKTLHLVADNHATHKHPVVLAWLAKHPRFVMHFTPTSASWLNTVERFFLLAVLRTRVKMVFRARHCPAWGSARLVGAASSA